MFPGLLNDFFEKAHVEWLCSESNKCGLGTADVLQAPDLGTYLQRSDRGGVSLAQTTSAKGTAPQPPKAQPPSDFKVPLLSDPLRLSDFPDMEPGAEIKGKLVEVSGFIQNTPNDGETATQRTDVWIAHTKSALYFAFICHDDHPGAIRGHLTRREDFSGDDSVSVIVDPFQDRRKGVLFTVNPAGVQADAAWTDTASVAYANDADYSYDQVWDSEARVTPGGWMALIAVPFRSLRFRTASSDWGVVFYRNSAAQQRGGLLAASVDAHLGCADPGSHHARD